MLNKDVRLEDELAGINDLDMSDFDFDKVEKDDFEEEPPKKPKIKLGQLYKLGKHYLMCGDSTDPKQVKKLMRGVQQTLCLLIHLMA